MQVEISTHGSFANTESWLARIAHRSPTSELNKIGDQGVRALKAATPARTGETAAGWYYKVNRLANGSEVGFYNNAHPETSANIAMLIQFGHGTKNGGYVPGYDYINPALRSIFMNAGDNLAREAFK